MAFNFTPANLIDAGGGLLFFLLGVLSLAFGWRTSIGKTLGGFALSFGALFVIINVWAYRQANPYGPLALASILQTIASVFGWALVAVLVKRLPQPQQKRCLVALSGLVALLVWILSQAWIYREAAGATSFLRVPSPEHTVLFFLFPLIVMWTAMAAITVATAFVHQTASTTNDRRSAAGLGLGVSLYLTFYVFVINAGELTFGFSLPLAILVGGAIGAWLFATQGPDASRARNVVLTLVVAALLGLGLSMFGLPFAQGGGPGLFRTLGAICVGIAILRHDLLGVALPQFTQKKAPLAGAALALLFIVAQITQNFFEARNSLIMGSVLAGAFLFAASPLQRAFERMGGHEPPALASRTRHASGKTSKDQEEAFRGAVRLAWKDRRFEKNEELALAVLADSIGLSAARATAIRHEIERENGVA